METGLHWLNRQWGRMVLSVGLGFSSIASNIGLMAIAGYLIAKAATHPSTILLLWVPIVSVRFFGLSRAAFRYAERLISHDVTFRILSHIRTRFYSMLEPRWPSAFAKWSIGDFLDRITNDIEVLQNVFLRVLTPPIVAFMAAGLSFAIISVTGSFLLGCVLLVGLTMVGMILPLVGHWSTRRIDQSYTDGRSRMYQKICDLVSGTQDLSMADDGGRQFLGALDILQERLNTYQRQLVLRQAVIEACTVVIVSGTAWAMLACAMPRVEHHLLGSVMLTVVALTSMASFEAVLPIPMTFVALGENVASVRRLQEIKNWPVQTPDPSCDHDRRRLPDHWHVRMNDVSFSYTSGNPILSGITLDLYPGKHMAIVGHNGAGKSTIIHLLTRLWDTQEGTVTIDDIDVRSLAGEVVRSGFVVISAHTPIFNASIADNLRIAKPTADLEELQKVAEVAQLSSWIDPLPEGFDTVIGEFGHVPSGGQRQRIAIARAVLANAPILLFDEPMEALDAQTALEIKGNLEAISRHKSVIWITHHLKSIGTMDEIIVLSQGSIIERGIHQELIHQSGPYQKMWDYEMDMF